MTLVLGLTGGIATGKSTADKFFEEKNIPIVDCDEIAHNIMNVNKPAWKDIKEVFGDEYLNEDQTINRKKLGKLVFNDPTKMKILNEITHPRIFQEMESQIAQYKSEGYSLIIVDAPVLFESHSEKYYNETLVISLPQDLQLKRLMARNNLTKEEALSRINSQMSLKEKEARATYVIENTGSVEDLYKKLNELLTKIKYEV
ncbi:dephospho-CoA kinase [Lactobacillus intestinalis]|uniref:Dephospho-CoA kinase n=1 Tax=Lactobacillus intestinalis DSM 6629 TaxID=1423761 RepID=A0ABR5PRY9_9LACO|nr:dephospho-CoA kinase [Lactobacillus intestinalis]KRM33735.1 dephospho-CoA kinase [Lactobacillus intestinalis DSM 6629]UTW40818.1 dephospho-CoA kinase [Lactobacillus intestinalis]